MTTDITVLTDTDIIALYWQREELAILETQKKYENYLTKIAYNILCDTEDCKESVNDTYLRAWNSMPPNRPDILSAYLAKITRRLSIDIFRKKHSQKRLGSQYADSLSELEESLSGGDSTRQTVDVHLLAEAINRYLRSLSPETRNIFICRYYFSDSLKDIASYLHISEAKIKSSLFRSRNGLKIFLEKEGFII